MDCFCGCGAKLPAGLTEANFVASRMALELLAWDKARVEQRLGPEAAELEQLIDRGEGRFRRLILLLHGEGRPRAAEESEEWLQESLGCRADRRDMTEGGSLLRGSRLRLTEDDIAALDRQRPGQSLSRLRADAPGATDGASTGDRAGGLDLADQLERLGRLRAEGVLTEDEFTAAKERVLGRA